MFEFVPLFEIPTDLPIKVPCGTHDSLQTLNLLLVEAFLDNGHFAFGWAYNELSRFRALGLPGSQKWLVGSHLHILFPLEQLLLVLVASLLGGRAFAASLTLGGLGRRYRRFNLLY